MSLLVVLTPFACKAPLSECVGGVVFAMFFWGLVFLWWRFADFRPKAHRRPSTFRVAADTVETNGMTFNNRDIHRLIVKNPMSRSGEIIVVGGVPNPGQGLGYAHRLALARICYSLDLEAGGKAYVLAGGMDDTTAFGLLPDVAAILGRQVQ